MNYNKNNNVIKDKLFFFKVFDVYFQQIIFKIIYKINLFFFFFYFFFNKKKNYKKKNYF